MGFEPKTFAILGQWQTMVYQNKHEIWQIRTYPDKQAGVQLEAELQYQSDSAMEEWQEHAVLLLK